MAVISTAILSDLALVYDEAGKSVTRRFADVKVAAIDSDVYSIAQSLNGVQDQTLVAVQRRTTNELEESV